MWCLGVALLSTCPAIAAEPPEYVSSFGPDGSASTGFGHAGPIAVDQGTHFVYVIDAGAGSLFKFDTAGNPVPFTGSAAYIVGNQITGLSFFGGPGEKQVAVDPISHRIYVTSGNAVRAFEESGEPAEFTAGPGAGTSEISGFTELLGVAVDANGSIYAGDYGPGGSGVVSIFSSSGEPITQFATGTRGAANVAVDTDGNVYVNFWLGSVSRFAPSEFPVTAATEYTADLDPFDPNPSYAVAVDPATNDVYIAERAPVARIVRYRQDGTLLASFAGPGEEGEVAESEGVAVDGASSRVFVSDFPSSGFSQVKIFQPLVAAPTIEAIFAKDITAGSATLGAEINPNTLETEYRFEYGLSACSGGSCTSVPAEGESIGDGHREIAVAAEIKGLAPSTTYHYRVVAENSLGVSVGEERTFTTQGTGLGFQLSDSRVWEMVSPPNKFGGMLVNPPRGPMQAAENGDGLAYQSVGSIEARAEGNRAIERSTVLARRGADGWHSKDISPPHTKATFLGPGNEYNIFSLDLSGTLLDPLDSTLLSPVASAKAPYMRENTEPPTFTPLVTSKDGYANVPPGTEFGGPDSEVKVAGASPDLTHVVLSSEAPLVAGAESRALYEWSDGLLQPVSVLPVDQGGGVVAGIFGSDEGSVRHAISEDGSRIFWGQGSYGRTGINTTALYLRDLDSEESLRLDVVEPGASGFGEASPVFQGASADGTAVYFTDARQLTEDASPEGRDLYRCVLSSGPGPLECDLSNLSAPRASSGESADVQGVLPGLSDDGRRLYFVAEGVLDPDPGPGGEAAVSGEPNLYLWEEGEGSRFITTLSSEDHTVWGIDNTQAGIAPFVSAASSSSGRYLAFMSESSLTGYENRDVASGVRDQEVFRYDAVEEALVCVSCNPTGASPEGQRFHLEIGFAKVDPQGLWEDRWVAAILPEARTSPDRSLYRPRVVLDNGRVFFNAADSLVPADTNRTWDVYQYEPLEVGSCPAGSAAVERTGTACVSLLSSGKADEESAFLDASADGDDVFFLSPGRLSVRDKDDVYDVYDARVNGREETLHPVSECVGEGCRPLAMPPSVSDPASEVFRGATNRAKCPKGKRKVKRHGRVRCVKRKHRPQRHPKRHGQRKGASR